MDELKVITVLPTFSRSSLLRKSVESVLRQTRPTDVFITLDDYSTDDSLAVLNEFKSLVQSKHPKMEFIVLKNEKNLGASGSMRRLFEEAMKLKPDWIWVMDDDAEADATALENLLKSEPASNPDAYLLETMVLDSNRVFTEQNRPAIFDPANFDFKGINLSEVEAGNPVEVNTGGYSGWFVRRECFENFGMPRAELYFWFDDTEFVMRVSRSKKVFLIPAAKMVHHAQSLVEHKKRWPFNAELPVIPEKHMQRYFYWNRNYLWLAKQWLPEGQYRKFWLKHVIRGLAAPVLFNQDKLLKRWRYVISAGLDAASERLGKKEGLS